MIKEAVILLGGMGTRLLPLTKTISKEMLPIYNVPTIYLLVKEAYLSGIKKIIFTVTEHNINLVKNFFSNDQYLSDFLKDYPEKQDLLKDINELINNMEFTYVLQKEKGTFGALYSTKDYLQEENFIVMYGDDLLDNDIPITKALIDNYQKTNKMQVLIKKENVLPKIGIVKQEKNYLIDLVPINEEHSSSIIIGRMLLNKKIFTVKDQLYKHHNDEYYLPYALLKFKGEVITYPYQGEYFNIGEKTGYIKASIYYALKNNETDLLEYINSLK